MDKPLHPLSLGQVDGHQTAEHAALHTEPVLREVPIVAVHHLGGNPLQRLLGAVRGYTHIIIIF